MKKFRISRNKPARIVAGLLALCIVAWLFYFAVGLLGNPVSWALASRTAKKHLATHYAGTDYEIDTVSYDFKTVGYWAHVNSPTLQDGSFTLHFNMAGQLTHDDYDSRVTGRGNVARRVRSEFRTLTDSVLKSPAFPYDFTIGYCELEFDWLIDEEPLPNAISREDLENGRIYDVGAMGTTNGHLVLYLDVDAITPEKAAEILKTAKGLFDSAGIGCYTVDLLLRYPPYEPGGYQRPEGELRLRGFLYEDIDGEGLLERIEKCRRDTLDYYAAKDAEK